LFFLIALYVQLVIHISQSIHNSASITALPSSNSMAFVGQTEMQSEHPTQEFDSTKILLLVIAKSEIAAKIIMKTINLIFIFLIRTTIILIVHLYFRLPNRGLVTRDFSSQTRKHMSFCFAKPTLNV